MHKRRLVIHPVNHQRPAPPYIVDALVRDLLHARRLDHDVEPVRVVLLQLLPLRGGVRAVELHVHVPAGELLRDVHLDALVRGDGDAVCAVELEELREDEPGRACAEHEDVDADGRGELVEPVHGAGGGLEERGFFVGEVVDFVDFVLFAESDWLLAH